MEVLNTENPDDAASSGDRDRRYKDGRPHEAVETEALSQQDIIESLRSRLEELLSEPVQAVQEAFTVPQAAQIFGRHPAWIYRRIYLRKLKVLRDAGRIMISRAEIDRMLGRQVVHVPRARRRNQKQPEAAAQ